jgi:FtsP/CotA-like multicopper oxidase with cupredoxin domain
MTPVAHADGRTFDQRGARILHVRPFHCQILDHEDLAMMGVIRVTR